MNLQLRPASADDVPGIEVITSEHARSGKTVERCRAEGFLISGFSSPTYLRWLEFMTVAVRGREVVGFTLSFPSEKLPEEIDDGPEIFAAAGGEPFLVIKQAGVRVACLGQGIGKRLYDQEFERARRPVFVAILADNPRSQRFHHSVGFRFLRTFSKGEAIRGLWRAEARPHLH